MDFLINSIYLATEGEGVMLGTPQVFVRFQGCAIGCVNCDSKDTWSFQEKQPRTLDDVLREVREHAQDFKIKRFSITGGDPLHPKNAPAVLALVKALRAELGAEAFINIEAAGTRIVDEIFDLVDYISFDYKTPSTQVRVPVESILRMARQYKGRFQIKAVVETTDDFKSVQDAYQQVRAQLGRIDFPWCLTPAYNNNELFPLKRFRDILDWNLDIGGPFRVIGQQHKWVYGPDVKQV